MHRRMEPCRVCATPAEPLFSGRLLNREVQYFQCPRCAYVQTERPHWLDEAYAQAINTSDTGILARNLKNRDIVLHVLALLGRTDASVVDAAGGLGILVRLLRDAGVDAYWSDAYAQNVVARGFEVPAAGLSGSAIGLLTSFESFEHFVDPLDELRRMVAQAPNILISTELIPTPAPSPGDWWYYGSDHGQHIGFFRSETLRYMASAVGRHMVSDGSAYHLFSERPVSERSWHRALAGKGWRARRVIQRMASKTWTDYLILSGSQQ